MSRKDGVLALLVVVVWGLNFVVIKRAKSFDTVLNFF